MVGNLLRTLLVCNSSTKLVAPSILNVRTFQTAATSYAARKGTRAKAKAKKVKVEVTKVGFIPHNLRVKKNQIVEVSDKHSDDSKKPICMDDVYPFRYHHILPCSAEEGIIAHKQTHHPTMYNLPDALIFAQIEMNTVAARKTRMMENFSRISLIPHGFPRDEQRTILVFCKNQQLAKESLDAGAFTAGGVEIIKKIQEGEIKLIDYDYVLAHPDILTDLVPIRGLMKRKFPSPRLGTLDTDIAGLVKKFSSGLRYKVVKDEKQTNFACVELPIGRLNMETKEITENLEAVLVDLDKVRPKRDGLFVTRVYLVSPPSPEKIRVNPFAYIPATMAADDDDTDDEDGKLAAEA